MAHLSLRLLGSFFARLDDQPVTGFVSDKARALLIYLAVEREQIHRRETLAGLLWPDLPEHNARTNLRNALANVRKVLDDRNKDTPFILATRQTLQFNPACDASVDVWDLTTKSSDAMLQLEDAVSLYKGEFLAGFSLKSDLFETWVSTQRESLHVHVMRVLHTLTEYAEQSGQRDDAIRYAQAQLALEPWRESAHRRLMRYYSQNDQRAKAVAQYETCERVLQEELGIVPEPETRALYQQLSSGDYNGRYPDKQALIENQIPQHNLPVQLTPIIGRDTERDGLVDLLQQPDTRLVTLTGPGGCGKTRLALDVAWSLVGNFSHGVWFVPMAAFDSPEAVITGIATALGVPLSKQSGDTTGRDEPGSLLEQLHSVLQHRIALLVMDNAEHLVKATAGDMTLTRLLTALLEQAPGINILVTSRSLLHSSGEVVVSLHPLDYPSDDVATLDELYDSATVQLFLHAAQRVRSNFSLTERNQQAVTTICAYVKGCPLATLLTASWVGTLSTAEIADMLAHPSEHALSNLDMLQSDWQDLPARHRDLRSVYEYSWRLLTPKAQQVFAVCCLFRGGFTREAAREIAGANALDLRNLIEASLTTRQPSGRYVIHELLRQFGEEKLQRDAIVWRNARLRYTEFYVPIIRQWERDVIGPNQMQVLHVIDAEIDNARALWYWTLSDGDFDVFLSILEGLLRYYARRYRTIDIVALCDYAVNQVEPILENCDVDTRISVVLGHTHFWIALYGTDQQREHGLDKISSLLTEWNFSDIDRKFLQARVLYIRGCWNATIDNPKAQKQLTLARRLFLDSGHVWDAGWASAHLAWSYLHDGQSDMAQRFFRQAIDISQETGDTEMELVALRGLGSVMVGTVQIAEAVENSKQAVQAARAFGNPAVLANQLFSYGLRLVMVGDFQDGIGVLDECITHQETAFGGAGTLTLSGMGWAYICLGAYAEAETWLQKAFDNLEKHPDQRSQTWCTMILGMAKSGQNELVKAADLARQAVEIYTVIGQWMELVMAHCLLAYVLTMQGKPEHARTQLFQAAQNALQRKTRAAATWLVAGCASLAAELGMAERAVELWECACREQHIANSRWYVDVVWRFVKQAAASLPEDVVAAAEARGRELNVWQTAEALVTELAGMAETQER